MTEEIQPDEVLALRPLLRKHRSASLQLMRSMIDPPGRRVLLAVFDEADRVRDSTQHQYLIFTKYGRRAQVIEL